MLENITFDNNKIAFVSGAHYFNVKYSHAAQREIFQQKIFKFFYKYAYILI